MRVMGIDPGSNCTGYGVVDDLDGKLHAVAWGSIRNNPRHKFPDRLKKIYQGLTEIIQQYSPDTVAVEDLFFAVNAKSALKLGQTRGVTLLAAANENTVIAEYSPLEVKKAIVGYGRAEKSQVSHMVTTLLGLKEAPEPQDITDALGVAICHIHCAGQEALIQKMQVKTRK